MKCSFIHFLISLLSTSHLSYQSRFLIEESISSLDSSDTKSVKRGIWSSSSDSSLSDNNSTKKGIWSSSDSSTYDEQILVERLNGIVANTSNVLGARVFRDKTFDNSPDLNLWDSEKYSYNADDKIESSEDTSFKSFESRNLYLHESSENSYYGAFSAAYSNTDDSFSDEEWDDTLDKESPFKSNTLESVGEPVEEPIQYFQDANGEIRFEAYRILGSGAYGKVYSGRNTETGELLAIKVISHADHTSANELIILAKLAGKSENIVNIKSYFCYGRDSLVIVTELLDINFRSYLSSLETGSKLSLNRISSFSSQILQGLSVLKQFGIVHADLKPENIVLKFGVAPQLKIIDFGMSIKEGEKPYEVVQTLFYRSPEVLLGVEDYTVAIDMWSFGCIVAEMLTGDILIQGDTRTRQMNHIIESFGIPPKEMIDDMDADFRERLFFIIGEDIQALFDPSPIEEFIYKLDPESENKLTVDFILGALKIDPKERWTPEEAFRHPLITGKECILPFEPNNY